MPAFGFVLLGLLILERFDTKKHAVLAGVCFGLAAVTKITYGIILPALFIAWIAEILLRRKDHVLRLTLIAIPAATLFFAWQCVEYASRPGGFQELVRYGFAAGGEGLFPVLLRDPNTLLRFPFVYFAALFVLFLVGRRCKQYPIAPATRIFIPAFIALFMLYFINGPIWYRHLLPAHMMLLPFVPLSLFAIAPRRIAIATLCFFILAQGWWQFDHRGSTPSGEASGAAERLLAQYADTPMVISAPDLYVLLSEVPQRLFLSEEVLGRDFRMFPDLPVLPEEHCLPWVRKLGWDEQKALGDRVRELYRRYVLIMPPASCDHDA